MQINTSLRKKIPFIAGLGLPFGLSSCGSYQYVGVDSDGIYDVSNPNTTYQEAVVEVNTNPNTSSYYKNYFREKSLEYDNMVNDNAIFTDIDEYQGTIVENDTMDNHYQGYSGWGQSNSTVSINIYDNGFNNWGWNNPYYSGWGWNSWGWNSWGWNGGFYDPYFYGGFYTGWSFYNPYRYHSYGYGYPYFNNGYYTNNYYGRNRSYIGSRRGVMASNFRSDLNNRAESSVNRTSRYNTNNAFNTSRRSSNVSSNSNTTNRVNSSGVYNTVRRRTSAVSAPTTNSTTRSSSTIRRSSQPSSATYNNSTRRSSPSSATPSSNYNSGSRSSSGSSGVSRSSSRSSSGSSSSSSGSSGRRRG